MKVSYGEDCARCDGGSRFTLPLESRNAERPSLGIGTKFRMGEGCECLMMRAAQKQNKLCKTGSKLSRSRSKYWSGRRESNPRMQLGKLPFYH